MTAAACVLNHAGLHPAGSRVQADAPSWIVPILPPQIISQDIPIRPFFP